MAYLCQDYEKRKRIRDFIDEYVRENGASPSLRDIADGTGISRAMVQRYMAAMREDGELDYGRRRIETPFTRGLSDEKVTVLLCGKISCGTPREAYPDDASYVSFPRVLVGEGTFFALEAEGDSMVDAGIDEGDLVIVRRQEFCRDGEIAVVLVDRRETTLKRVFRTPEQGAYRLHAENSTYSALERDRIVRDPEIQGVAVKVIKNVL